jgi:hypothetical protein
MLMRISPRMICSSVHITLIGRSIAGTQGQLGCMPTRIEYYIENGEKSNEVTHVIFAISFFVCLGYLLECSLSLALASTSELLCNE